MIKYYLKVFEGINQAIASEQCEHDWTQYKPSEFAAGVKSRSCHKCGLRVTNYPAQEALEE